MKLKMQRGSFMHKIMLNSVQKLEVGIDTSQGKRFEVIKGLHNTNIPNVIFKQERYWLYNRFSNLKYY